MPYNLRNLKKDAGGIPIPQIFNPATDDFEPVYGYNNSSRVILYDKNGNPLLTQPNPGYVADTVLHGKMDTLLAKVEAIRSTDGIKKITDNVPVELKGSKVQVDTALNSVSMAAGAIQAFDFNPTDEDEIWVLVSIDKQPWALHGNNLVYTGTDGGAGMFFPTRGNVTTTHNTFNPCVSLHLGGISVVSTWGLTPPTTISEARQCMVTPYQTNLRARITNLSAETATVTVKLVRVWKKGG